MGPASKINNAAIGVMEINGDAISLANADATIGLLRFSRENASVEHLFIHPSYPRQDCAQRLLKAAETAIGRPPRPGRALPPDARLAFMTTFGV